MAEKKEYWKQYYLKNKDRLKKIRQMSDIKSNLQLR